MNAEIVTSGTELLLGETVDTNSVYIARALRDIGVNLYYKTSVGDNVERMARMLRDGVARSDLIITTGGLGPTVDDVTREAVAQATGRALELYPECLASIAAVFARWGRAMGENNRRQAYLPGVPREMEHLLQQAVLPYLRDRLGDSQVMIKARTLRTVGMGESWIDERIDPLMRSANPTVGLAAHTGIVDVRITARARNEAAADRMIAEMERAVRERLGEYAIFGADGASLEEATAAALAAAGVRLALVESDTGGEVATRLRSVPASAAAVTAAYVVGSPEELSRLLAVAPALVDAYGWVSQMVATAAATALTDTYEGGWGLAILGDMTARDDFYGTDTGQSFLALVTPDATHVRQYPYGGQGAVTRTRISLAALDLLRCAALDRRKAK